MNFLRFQRASESGLHRSVPHLRICNTSELALQGFKLFSLNSWARAIDPGTEPSLNPGVLLKSPLRFYITLFARSFWIGMAFLLVTNLLDGFYPLLIKRALDQVSAGTPWRDVLISAVMFFALMSGLAITRYCWRTFFGSYHTRAAEDLRCRLFSHLSKMDPNFYSKNQIGELMSLLVNDIQAFRQAIGSSVLIIVDGVVVMLIIVPVMINLNPEWTWKALIFLPFLPFLIRKITNLIFERYNIEQEQLSRMSGFTQETLTGIRVLKSFVQEKTRMQVYRGLNLEYEKSCNRVAIVDSTFFPTMEFGVGIGSAILIFVAAPDLISGAASIGTFIAFQRYIMKMIWPMSSFGFGFSQYQKGMASFARIKKILETQTALPDTGTQELITFETLAVKKLSYIYPGQNEVQLQNVSFEMKKGEKLGIVGPIGSGKSTLVHLLARLLPSEPGQILINGQSVENFPLATLHRKILVVSQEPTLFSMSIEENLKLAQPTASFAELEDWLRQVQIADEIKSLPGGMKTELGEKGVNLSGGQKQRLCLARGFVVQPELLILDDTLSAVDSHTEEKLIHSLEIWNQSLILISHRLSVLKSCDRILVLNQGRIEALGTWNEAHAQSPVFRQLCTLQEVNP